MAAKELTARGFEVLVLEAGPPVNPARDFTHHTWPYQVMYRGFGPPGWKQQEQWMQDTASHFSRHFYVKDSEHPYTTDPGNPFMWVRARIVGGKTLHWGRLSWRLSDLDFKAASHDGFGDDWPISYAEMAPYYDRVEEFIGVSGNADGLPHVPDGKYMPAMPLTCGEHLLRKGAEKTGRRGISMRVAMLTSQPKPFMKGRRKCHYCGHFGGIGASGFFPMLAGRDPINEDGKATGIFIPRFRNLDKKTKHPKFLRGYGFECGSGTSLFPGMARRLITGFGAEYKKQVRRF